MIFRLIIEKIQPYENQGKNIYGGFQLDGSKVIGRKKLTGVELYRTLHAMIRSLDFIQVQWETVGSIAV